jgi:hypothetical protein
MISLSNPMLSHAVESGLLLSGLPETASRFYSL